MQCVRAGKMLIDGLWQEIGDYIILSVKNWFLQRDWLQGEKVWK